MSTKPCLIALVLLAAACGNKSEPRPATEAPAPSVKEPQPERKPEALRIDGPFPVVEGTRFTFRGSSGEKDFGTWDTTIVAVDRAAGRLQYDPHNDVATVFTKRGFYVDAGGISIAGDDIDGPLPPVRAVDFPLTPGATHEVQGLFATTYTVGAREKVTVAAGTFDAYRVAIEDGPNGEAAVWIAPGTGVVKFQHSSGRIDELVTISAP